MGQAAHTARRGVVTTGHRVTEAVGSAPRRIQGRRGSAWVGEHSYRDPWGHLMEADLSDYLERAGFLGAHNPVAGAPLDRRPAVFDGRTVDLMLVPGQQIRR